MTVAALEAEALDTYFRHHSNVDIHALGFARSINKMFFKLTIVPWLLATSEDLRYAETEGKRMFGLGIMHWYIGRLFALSAIDPFICQCFYELLTMMKPPTIATHPRVIWCVWFKKIPAHVLSPNTLQSPYPVEANALLT